MAMNQEYADFFQVSVMDSYHIRQQQQQQEFQLQHEHNNDNSRNRRSRIQEDMRRSQFQLLFWSKYLLCWLSLGVFLILVVWHSVGTPPSSQAGHDHYVTMVKWADESHNAADQSEPQSNDSFLRTSKVFQHHFLRKKSNENSIPPASEPMPQQQQPQSVAAPSSISDRQAYLLHADNHASSAFSVPSSRQPSYQYFRQKQKQQQEAGAMRYSDDENTRVSAEEDSGDGEPDPAPTETEASDNGDDHDDDIEDPDSSSQEQHQQNMSSNPTVYGWTPEAFPNPMTNPIRCAIAYLPEFLNHPPSDDSASPTAEEAATATNDNDIPDNGQMISPLQLSPEQEQQQQQEHPLRLCDPDWVLGGMYLEQVAHAMNNFTSTFGKEQFYQRQEDPENLPLGVVPEHDNILLLPWVDLAIATARKMDLQAVLRDGSYYAYEDDDDMVNDAAQYFARGLHDAWWPAAAATTDQAPGDEESGSNGGDRVDAEHGILVFLSIQDRVCFISTGASIANILPWWRLDHIVTSMKPALRERDYGSAVLLAIQNLAAMLEAGPPSLADRLHDFCARFGVVILFATFTFVFGAWGEYRDRRKRFQFAEERSKFKGEVDREKARLLQQGYKTRQCPICLEAFCTDKAAILPDSHNSGGGYGSTSQPTSDVNDYETVRTLEEDDDDSSSGQTKDKTRSSFPSLMGLSDSNNTNSGADSYGIPLYGADGKRIKLLRCGHIFCESCWKSWVHSGCGNPCNCPVCRQDIGKAPRQSISGASASMSRRPSRSAEPRQISRDSDQDTVPSASASTENESSLVWGNTYDSVAETRLSTLPTRATNLTSAGNSDSSRSDGNCSSPHERRPLLP